MNHLRGHAEAAATEDGLGHFKRLRGRTADEITRRLIRAIFEHRLPPSTRITEDKLSRTFGVSRTLARQATSQLCEMGVFVKKPNHSCIVAHPSREEAQALIDARRMIEPELIRQIVRSASKADLQLLDEHLALEQGARLNGDRSRLIRLTGEFHLKLAQLARNPYLASFVMQLQVLTCLAILVHTDGEAGCPRDDHEDIVEKIRQRDADGAVLQMLKHLQHIELDLHQNDVHPDRQLEETFRWLAGETELD
ncbi:MAG: GntR family transcriptional regulator [Limimaricola soesokkakensis]|uniref:GntR family transcriptional regulator n=1 Tax=Limimaricola soesokkakensis TaxID=1343159 RepID=UPI00405A1D3E